MINMTNILPGLKTHLVVIGALAVIWGSFLQGGMDVGEAVSQSLMALGYSTLRIGLKNATGK